MPGPKFLPPDTPGRQGNRYNRAMNQDELKRAAARAAMDHLVEGEVVGVGSGSTVNFFIEELGRQRERFPSAVSSSERSSALLRDQGLEVLDLNQVVTSGRRIPVYVDGADEINPSLQMIKGGGGALTREKIVAAASGRFVCIVDQSKCVQTLGRFALPIEVIPMAAGLVGARLLAMGGNPRVRAGFVTDNGNMILDVAGLSITEPALLEAEINQWPGVVTVGLFALKPAALALVATPQGVELREPQASGGT